MISNITFRLMINDKTANDTKSKSKYEEQIYNAYLQD